MPQVNHAPGGNWEQNMGGVGSGLGEESVGGRAGAGGAPPTSSLEFARDLAAFIVASKVASSPPDRKRDSIFEILRLAGDPPFDPNVTSISDNQRRLAEISKILDPRQYPQISRRERELLVDAQQVLDKAVRPLVEEPHIFAKLKAGQPIVIQPDAVSGSGNPILNEMMARENHRAKMAEFRNRYPGATEEELSRDRSPGLLTDVVFDALGRGARRQRREELYRLKRDGSLFSNILQGLDTMRRNCSIVGGQVVKHVGLFERGPGLNAIIAGACGAAAAAGVAFANAVAGGTTIFTQVAMAAGAFGVAMALQWGRNRIYHTYEMDIGQQVKAALKSVQDPEMQFAHVVAARDEVCEILGVEAFAKEADSYVKQMISSARTQTAEDRSGRFKIDAQIEFERMRVQLMSRMPDKFSTAQPWNRSADNNLAYLARALIMASAWLALGTEDWLNNSSQNRYFYTDQAQKELREFYELGPGGETVLDKFQWRDNVLVEVGTVAAWYVGMGSAVWAAAAHFVK